MKTKRELLQIAKEIIRNDHAVDTAILALGDSYKVFEKNQLDEDDMLELAKLLEKHREDQGGFSDSEFYGAWLQAHAHMMREFEEILDAKGGNTDEH